MRSAKDGDEVNGMSARATGREAPAGASPRVAVLNADEVDEQTRRRLVALLNEAFGRHRWLFPGDRTTYEQFVAETAGTEALVLAVKREFVGMAVIHPEGEALYLGMVAVAPPAQGRGYARRLLQAAEALARERGLRAVTLTTVAELGNAVYWQQQGFAVTAEERRPAGYWGATAPHSFVWMEKRLD